MVDFIVLLLVALLLLVTLRGSIKQFKTGNLQKTSPKLLEGPVVSEKLIRISGMTDPNSAERVKRAIDSVDGCAGEVHLDQGTAICYCDRANVNDVDIKHAVEGAGYIVDSIS